MKTSPALIVTGALAMGVVFTLVGVWIERPAPPPVPAAFAAADSPAHQEGDGSPNSAGAAALPGGGGGSLATRPDSGTSDRPWPVAGSGPEAQPGVPIGQSQQGAQDRPEESSAYGSVAIASGASGAQGSTGASGTGPLIAAGGIPLPPIPASAQVPLAFRPLAPPLSTPNQQVASGLQSLQQNFLNALSGQNQDPNDPGYIQRWYAAQFQSDQQYRTLVGDQAYLIEQSSVAGK